MTIQEAAINYLIARDALAICQDRMELAAARVQASIDALMERGFSGNEEFPRQEWSSFVSAKAESDSADESLTFAEAEEDKAAEALRAAAAGMSAKIVPPVTAAGDSLH